MAITRPTITDDNGDGLSGTIYNAAFWADLFDKIDVALSTITAAQVNMTRGTSLTLANGKNNNVAIGATSFIGAIAGPTAAFSISGIVAGTDGQLLALFHNVGQILTLDHADAASAANNRVYCPGAVAVATSANMGSALLQYNTALPGWIVLSIK